MLKHEYKRLKFSLSHSQRKEIMERIGKNNAVLAELTNSSRLLEPSRRSRQFPSKQFRFVQQHADYLYALLKRRWTCDCGTPHDANLRLNARLSDPEISRIGTGHRHVGSLDLINFNVIFSVKTANTDVTTSWSWQETEIRAFDQQIHHSHQNSYKPPIPQTSRERGPSPSNSQSTRDISDAFQKLRLKTKKGVRFADSSLAPDINETCTLEGEQNSKDLNDLAQISNICHALQKGLASAAYSHKCLGYLCDEGRQPLGIYLAGSSIAVSRQRSITSLAELLNNNNPKSGQSSLASRARTVYKGDRLRIALTVASSVLQLYKTPWLREDWNMHNILIDESADTYGDQVYVSGDFPKVTVAKQAAQRQMMYHLVRNETLFSLGILLIELCLGQPLGLLRTPEDPLNTNGVPDIFTDWSTTNRLLNSVYSEAGMRYGDATRRCIRCEFDERETTLDNDAFRQKFYDNVITLLEEDVKAFDGKLFNTTM